MTVPDTPSRAAPAEVQQARAALRRTRETYGVLGGVTAIVGLVGAAASSAPVLVLAGLAAGILVVTYKAPVSATVSQARRVVAEWESLTRGVADQPGPYDAQAASAEALLARIEEYSGTGPAVASAQAMVQLIYDSQADFEAVATLAAAGAANQERQVRIQEKAQALTARIEGRVDHALSVLTEIYEAVLSQDDVALREVVARAESETGLLRAQDEISQYLEGRRRE